MRKFSIVAITYQNKKLLKNVLEAMNRLRGFKREEYEIIVVDDGSTDGTGEYIKGINRNFDMKYIYLERDSNSRRSRTRNTGWKNAEGEIVAFIDGDILIHENYLLELERCYKMEKNLVVIGHYLGVPDEITYESVCDGSAFKKHIFNKFKEEEFENRHFVFGMYSYNLGASRLPWVWVYSGNMVAPMKLLQQLGGFDENFKGWGHEDVELGLRLQLAGAKIVINCNLEAIHQPHPVYSKNKEADSDACARYFLSKHSELFPGKTEELYDFFVKGTPKFVQDEARLVALPRKIIEFKDKSSLDEVKEKILRFSGRKGVELVVIDYVEDTDLDIWVQLLGRTNSLIMYYPVSHTLVRV